MHGSEGGNWKRADVARRLSTLPGWSLVRPQLGPFTIRSPVPNARSFPVCFSMVPVEDVLWYYLDHQLEPGTLY